MMAIISRIPFHRRILFLNGPPGCGKDTLANHLWSVREDVSRLKFSQPIKDALRAAYQLTDGQLAWLEHHDNKSTPTPLLHGLSWRQAQIDFSEKYMKPLYGQSIFGEIALKRTFDMGRLVLVSDSGFVPEAEVLAAHYGNDNCMVVHIKRPKHDFTGDSRSYINVPGVRTLQLHNDGKLNDMFDVAKQVIAAWLGEIDYEDVTVGND
jgi:hypothetical protein